MRAVVTESPGGWEHTHLRNVGDPIRRTDEVLVEIRAAGLNPADYFQIEGKYPGGPAAPFIAGRDAAGVVIDGVPSLPTGSKVIVLQSSKTDLAEGTFCERQRFTPDRLAALPEGWSFEEGAVAPLVYQTAWRALVEVGQIEQGQTVVVTGASGGVGTAAVQLARGLGATVVALSRSAGKRAKLAELGAQHVFSPDVDNLKKAVQSAVGRRGVDLVIENVGGASLTESVHLLGSGGRISVVGLLAGVEGTVPIPSLIFKQATIAGVLVSDVSPSHSQAMWLKIVDVLGAAGKRPIVDSRFPIADFKAAFAHLHSSLFGKVALVMKE